MKSALYLFASILFLSSCQPENRIYEKHQSLSPDVEWHASDIKEFDVNILDTSSSYDFKVAFRFAQGLPWKQVKIQVEETAPSGKIQTNLYSLKVRDDEGNYLGEAGYDIWDSEHSVAPKKVYTETGNYTYKISHQMDNPKFPFAMEIGLVIDKNK